MSHFRAFECVVHYILLLDHLWIKFDKRHFITFLSIVTMREKDRAIVTP